MRDSHKILVVIFFKDSTEEIYRNRIDLILLQSERKVKRSSKIDFFSTFDGRNLEIDLIPFQSKFPRVLIE